MPVFYGTEVASALMLGTAGYPSPWILADAFRASGAGIATVSLRREAGGGQDFLRLVEGLGVRLLPNTAGCHTAQDAVRTLRLAREAGAQSEEGAPVHRRVRALGVTRRTSFMLSGAQLGITLTTLAAGFLAEHLVVGSRGAQQ